MVPISKKNIIIASVAAVAVLIVVVIVVVSRKGTAPVARGIFKRCDGRSDPIEEIKIKACPDSAKVSYCEIKSSDTTVFEIDFTPAKDFGWLNLVATDPTLMLAKANACKFAAKCPFKAGEKNTLKPALDGSFFTSGKSGQLKFELIIEETDEQVYCVEFPIKVV